MSTEQTAEASGTVPPNRTTDRSKKPFHHILLSLSLHAVVFLSAPVVDAAIGDLTPSSCVSDTGGGGACANGRALKGATAVTLSPDGRNAYAVSDLDSAVLVFERDIANGTLTQKAGTAGCISEDGSDGLCVDGKALVTATDVVVSPDGRNVYVASKAAAAVAVFDRDAITGTLTQKAGTAGCISNAGFGGCAVGRALGGASALIGSPDGRQIYVAASGSDAVVRLFRFPDGQVTQTNGLAGCISESGEGNTCTVGRALDGADGLAMSGDGRTVYVTAGQRGALAVFTRDSAGVLTQKSGANGCVAESAIENCAVGRSLANARGVAVSPDRRHVYVVAGGAGVVSLAVFDRDLSTGIVQQKGGSTGCFRSDGMGDCAVAAGIDPSLLARVNASPDGRSKANSLTVSPDGTSVYVATNDGLAILHSPVCGNGIVEPGEICDDGNLADSDGCSADCVVITPTPSPTRTPTGTPTPTPTPTRTATVTLIATRSATATLAPTASFTPTPSAPARGDCNGDGQFNSQDLTRITQILNRCTSCPGGAVAGGCVAVSGADKQCFAADLDQNGCISAGELTRILYSLQKLAGG